MVELTALSARSGRAIATFWYFYVLHHSTARFSRGGEKCYIYFVDNSLLFRTVKEFSKLVKSWLSYCKNSTPRCFIRHSVVTRINLGPNALNI